MNEITVNQALNEFRALAKIFRTITQFEEALNVVANLEQTENKLLRSIDSLKIEEKEFNELLDKTSIELDKQVSLVEEKKKEAIKLIEDAKDKAKQLVKEAQDNVDTIKKDFEDEVLKNKQVILNQRKEIESIKSIINDLQSQRIAQQEQFSKEQERILTIFSK